MGVRCGVGAASQASQRGCRHVAWAAMPEDVAEASVVAIEILDEASREESGRLRFVAGDREGYYPGIATASGHSTVLLLQSTEPENDTPFTGLSAECLRARGVVVVDPSSVSVTYHEREWLFAAVFSDALHISGERTAWIETRYHSERALFAKIDLHVTPMPYNAAKIAMRPSGLQRIALRYRRPPTQPLVSSKPLRLPGLVVQKVYQAVRRNAGPLQRGA